VRAAPWLALLLAVAAATATPAAAQPEPAPATPAPAVPAAGDTLRPAPAGAVASPARSAELDPDGEPGVSGTRVLLVTPLLPGWGQLATGNSWRAVLAFGAQTMYWSQLLMNDRKAVRWKNWASGLPAENTGTQEFYAVQVEEYRERVRDFAWWSLGALLIIALDAYVDAQLADFDRDSVPVPNRWDAVDGSPQAAAGAASPDLGLVVLQWRARF